jgi:hypothetical protein
MTADPGSSRPAVQPQAPPAVLLRVVNAVLRTLLRTPLHRLVDGGFLLLHVTGRKSGRRYDVVVGRHEIDGGLFVATSAPWRKNLTGGAPVEVTDRGRVRAGHGELVKDPGAVAALYLTEIQRIGRKRARRLGIRINVPRTPTAEELADSARRDGLSAVRVRLS